ncbi:hypothetical protein QR680_008701 [Steinernema hermaphroditum]|uniref:Uncharacterized protein n=1 Tax=Steinernema hermaphroditum TaxID=289476 RepID=A0AA39IK18_9BILA|nr:hypothetical protein QR680_008701 [Steinernema hermaphroditum]
MKSHMNYVLLQSEPKATSFFIKVIEKKGQDLWTRGSTESQKAAAFQLVLHVVRKKYAGVTEEKLKEIWTNLQTAYLCPEISCRYRPKLDFLRDNYPIAPTIRCDILIEKCPQQEEIDQLVQKRFGISMTTSPPAHASIMNPAKKDQNRNERSSKPSASAARPATVQVGTQTGEDISAMTPQEKRAREVRLYSEIFTRRLAMSILDPDQQQRAGKYILKKVAQTINEGLEKLLLREDISYQLLARLECQGLNLIGEIAADFETFAQKHKI